MDKIKLEQNIAKLFKLINNDKNNITKMYQYNSGWYYSNGYIELYIDIKDIKFSEDKTLNEIRLYINQDDNTYKTIDIYSIDELIKFLNDCVEWIDKVKDAMEACPY